MDQCQIRPVYDKLRSPEENSSSNEKQLPSILVTPLGWKRKSWRARWAFSEFFGGIVLGKQKLA